MVALKDRQAVNAGLTEEPVVQSSALLIPRESSALPSDEPKLTENAAKVLKARYLKKNEAGECVETPGQLFRRVAKTIADVELTYGGSATQRQAWEDRFYNLMADGLYQANSPTLMNAGREMGMLSACFVLPVRDSISDIFDSIKHTALIQKAGGGTGFAFDELRPTGDFIASSGGTTSGPITFWKAFSEATNAIQQGAFRRGANMGMMYIHHPDILKFLHAKQDLTQFTNYNISVKVTDAWMEQFRADPDSPHVVRNPRNGKCFVIPRDVKIWEYNIRSLIEVDNVAPVDGERGENYFKSPLLSTDLPDALLGHVYTKRMVWDIIVQNAWHTGEPGVVFIDRINEFNPTPHVGRIEATNPCGEQPLLPYEACNLGSVNLGAFVREECTPEAHVDWEALRVAVHDSTRFLDNVIDANNYPLPEIDQVCKANRKIGLGIMGFADALYKLNVAYNSDEGVAWGERFMKFVNDEAHDASETLARERGSFPNWKGSRWDTVHHRPMRNAAVTTVAPTGTISIIANCSGGVEPMFSLAFIRNVLRGQKEGARPLVEVNDTFKTVAAARGFLSDELLERIAHEGTLAHIDEIPPDVKEVFVCAHDITPDWHMRMQAAFQQHCDSSISKTINFPNAATREEVEQIYTLAFDLRCKGVTVYRDGCRAFQPMALKKEESGGTGVPSVECTESGSAGILPARTDAPKSEHEAQAGEVEASIRPGFGGAGILPALGGAGIRPALGGAGILPAVAGGTGVPPVFPAADTAPELLPPVSAPLPSAPLRAPTPAPAQAGSLCHPSPAGNPSPRIEPMDLPEIVSGLRIRQMTPFGNMHVKITVDPRSGRELEIFAQLGKGGDVATGDLEGMCRIGSLWLRAGGSLRHLIKQWQGIGSSLQIPTKSGRITSLPDGLAAALQKYLRAKERFGLHALLLGLVDPAEMDKPDVGHGVGQPVVQASVPAGSDVGQVTVLRHLPSENDPHASDSTTRAASPNGTHSALVNGSRGNASPGNGSYTNGSSNADQHSPTNGHAPDAVVQRLANDAMPPQNGNGLHSSVHPSVVDVRSVRAPVPDVHGVDPGATSRRAGMVDGLRLRAPLPDADCAFAPVPDIRIVHPPVVDVYHDHPPVTDATATPESASFELTEITLHTSGKVTHCDLIHQHDAAPFYKIACPECQATIMRQEGCLKCHGCGWAQC